MRVLLLKRRPAFFVMRAYGQIFPNYYVKAHHNPSIQRYLSVLMRAVRLTTDSCIEMHRILTIRSMTDDTKAHSRN
jgi:hypothetical protein